jgi:uncharacterized membrane protein
MDPRWPRLLFLLLAVFAAVHFAGYYSQLPPVVASHFDAQGVANGWQTKQAFYAVFGGVTVLAFVLVYAVPALIGKTPVSLINLPNKNYWLSAQHWTASQAFMSAWFGWFGCVVFMVMILAFDYAVKQNVHEANAVDLARLWYGLAAFGAFSLVWIAAFLVRFARLPRDVSDSR